MLLTKKQNEKLRKNFARNKNRDLDLKPFIKLYNPVGSEIWFITELDDQGFYHGLLSSNYRKEMVKMTEKEIKSFCTHPDYKVQTMGFHPFYTISEYYRRTKNGEHVV